MHLTTIVTKDGKDYNGYVDKTRLKEGKRVAYVMLLLSNGKLKKIFIEDIKKASTEHERVSAEQPDTTLNNLKQWKWIIKQWG